MKQFFTPFRIIGILVAMITFILAPGRTFGAYVTTYSDTLETSQPSIDSNHTILWDVVDASGIVADDVVKITFASSFDTSTIIENDVDIGDNGADISTATDCTGSEKVSVVMTADVLILTGCTGDSLNIVTGHVVTVKIGTNAVENGAGTHKIQNPTAGFYGVDICKTNACTGYTDVGDAQVAIISAVTTTATVGASLSVTVSLVAASVLCNGATTSIETTSSTVPFSALTVNADKIGAHSISVSTNAVEGYTGTIEWTTGTGEEDGLDSNANNIDGFDKSAASNASPQAWAAGDNPSGVAANANSGWYGYTTNDATLSGTPDRFTSAGGDKWAPFNSAPYEVAYDAGAVNAQVTCVGHKIEVNAFQPAGTYTGTVEYVYTAIF